MKRVLCLFVMLGFLISLAQRLSHSSSAFRAEPSEDLVSLHQALLDLTYPFTIMCIAAHPDDEDREGLAFYRMKYGARTVIVTATRGEGGQNSSGPELNEELGVLRVGEMARAARQIDALTFNLAMPDFGFSKSAEETFRIWNRKEALRRLVYAVRYFRPDIIITQHARDTGHGHHQAIRLLAEEAFDASADRYAFPEQISARLDPWKAKRLFVRTTSKTRYDTEFDVNETAPVRNERYSKIAYAALSEHRSQGPWVQPSPKGERLSRYNLVKKTEGEFRRWFMFEQGLATPEIYSRILPIVFGENASEPEKAARLPRQELISKLTKALNALRVYLKEEGVNDGKGRELESKLQRALAIALKIGLEITPSVEKTAQGLEFAAAAKAVNKSELQVQISDLRLLIPEGWDYKETSKLPEKIDSNSSAASEFLISVDPQVPATLPTEAHLYDLDLLEPQIGAQLKASWKDLAEPITLFTRTRVEISPSMELEATPNDIPVNVIDAGQTDSFPVQVKLKSNLRSPVRGRISIAQSQVIRVSPEIQEFSMGPLTPLVATFLVTVGRPTPEGSVALPLTVSDEYGRVIAESTLKFHLINVSTLQNLRVGYLRSYDFTVPKALAFLGINNSELTVPEIASSNLSLRYDAIVLDNRAYLAHPDLEKANGKLMEFVSSGGTLMVFYQRPSDWNDKNLSPYPIKLSDQRVTDETAPITIMQPEHPIFRRPNRITEDAFNNWRQERGLSFPSQWDERFQALLSCSDPGEEALKGGLLVTEFGRGKYIYTSYAIYRQLRTYSPGAYKLFSNMIGYGR